MKFLEFRIEFSMNNRKKNSFILFLNKLLITTEYILHQYIKDLQQQFSKWDIKINKIIIKISPLKTTQKHKNINSKKKLAF